MGGSETRCECWLGAISNKLIMSNPKISLINHIDTPHNKTSNNMLIITDYGANIHIARQATPTTTPVIMYNEMKSRLPDGITMESPHIATLLLPGQGKVARQIHVLPIIQTAPSISLGVLCDDG